MTAGKCEISRCGLCRFYSHEGRRDGVCNQLSVNVSPQWKACSLAVSPFVIASQNSQKPVGINQEISRWPVELSVAELSKEDAKRTLLNPALAPANSSTLSVTSTSL